MGILKVLRQQALLSQRELAERADIDRRTIINLEKDPPAMRPFPQTLRKLAHALGVEPARLAPLLEQEEIAV